MIRLEKGRFEPIVAVRISPSKNRFVIIANISANLKKMNETNMFMNPNITIPASNGIDMTLDMKKVNDIVLKLYIPIGVVKIFAESVIDNSPC